MYFFGTGWSWPSMMTGISSDYIVNTMVLADGLTMKSTTTRDRITSKHDITKCIRKRHFHSGKFGCIITAFLIHKGDNGIHIKNKIKIVKILTFWMAAKVVLIGRFPINNVIKVWPWELLLGASQTPGMWDRGGVCGAAGGTTYSSLWDHRTHIILWKSS